MTRIHHPPHDRADTGQRRLPGLSRTHVVLLVLAGLLLFGVLTAITFFTSPDYLDVDAYQEELAEPGPAPPAEDDIGDHLKPVTPITDDPPLD